MGIMPFHLEKGVMGLRFDYLTRSPQVRAFFVGQLTPAGADPFAVASAISIPWPGGRVDPIVIDALNADFNTFKQALEDLWALDGYRFDAHERRRGSEYQDDNNALEPRNRDTPGNRQAFIGYWTNAAAANRGLKNVMRTAMLAALQTATAGPPRPRIDYWWDCTLADGSPPTVIYSDQVPSIARVLFCTPHAGVVESTVRGALPPR